MDAALRDFALLEDLALRNTALSCIDPRAKILATLGFIVAVVSFDRYAVAPLLPFALFPVIGAGYGNIPLRPILRTVLLASPVAVLVGLFNPLFDQTLLLEVAGYPVAGGWVSLLSILVRFALTMSASLVLVGSTGFFQMGAGLARLGVPRVFTTQLLFMHRYALVLAGEAGRMNLARELRGGPARAMPLAVYGSLLGHLLLRAMDRSERIYQAMRLRGFRGNLHSPRPLQWRTRDSFLLATSWAVFALARQFDLAHLLGRVLVGSVR